MGLFEKKDFISHSGLKLHWKIECNELTNEDWETLALMTSEILPTFSQVIGIPRGGLRFAEALRNHTNARSNRLLVADDVLTTGQSFLDAFATVDYNAIGVVVFCRNPNGVPIPHVTALFQIARPFN